MAFWKSIKAFVGVTAGCERDIGNRDCMGVTQSDSECCQSVGYVVRQLNGLEKLVYDFGLYGRRCFDDEDDEIDRLRDRLDWVEENLDPLRDDFDDIMLRVDDLRSVIDQLDEDRNSIAI